MSDTLRVLCGDCRETIKSIDDGSIQCCITSPPYWGLRDYGCDAQLGMEETPEEFVTNLVDVFREVRRVLRDDGTLWLNLGDSYAGNCSRTSTGRQGMGDAREGIYTKGGEGLKAKDLVGIPWMVAFALRADGWYLRQDIIWHKPNPMPESVTDRCTKSHEYIFLLSKSAKYYYDADAIRENNADPSRTNYTPGKEAYTEGNVHDASGRKKRNDGFAAYAEGKICDGRNKRSVWTVTTKPYKDAHFAVFPTELITPCVLAGTKAGDTILDPFGGSGTTGKVAIENGRKAVLCELNPEYVELIEKRTTTTLGLGLDL